MPRNVGRGWGAPHDTQFLSPDPVLDRTRRLDDGRPAWSPPTGVGHAAPDTCLASGAGSVTCTYQPSDGLVRFVVPDRVTWLDITAAGGAGGESFGVPGGKGALIHNAAVAVATGDTLFLRSGWSGADSGRAGARGGMGGVRNAGSGGNGGVEGAAGGGGASEVFDGTSGRSLLIAAGGGGAGGDGGGAGIPMFGGQGGDAGAGGGEGSGEHSGEGGSAPSVGINRSLAGPAGHARREQRRRRRRRRAAVPAWAVPRPAPPTASAAAAAVPAAAVSGPRRAGRRGLSAEHDGSIVIRYTPGAPAPNAAPATAPADAGAARAARPTPAPSAACSPAAPPAHRPGRRSRPRNRPQRRPAPSAGPAGPATCHRLGRVDGSYPGADDAALTECQIAPCVGGFGRFGSPPEGAIFWNACPVGGFMRPLIVRAPRAIADDPRPPRLVDRSRACL